MLLTLKYLRREYLLVGFLMMIQVLSLFRNYPYVPSCSRLVEIGPWIEVLVNCDSSVFFKDVEEPMRLINGISDYQDRPLYAAVAAILLLIMRVIGIPESTQVILGNSGSYSEYSSSTYIALILVNSFILMVSIVLALRVANIIAKTYSINAINSLLLRLSVALLVTLNEVSKTFFWTPHTQIPNLLLPIYALYLILTLQQMEQHYRFYAHNIFVLALTFVYPLMGILFLILLFAQYRSFIYRFTVSASIASLFILYPIAIEVFGGTFRSVTVSEYRQFVWIWDFLRDDQLIDGLYSFFQSFLGTISWTPSVFVLSVVILLLFNRNRYYVKEFPYIPIFAFGITYFFTTFAIGFYARRLTYGSLLFFVLICQLLLAAHFGNKGWFRVLLIGQSFFLIGSFAFTNGPLV